MYHQSDYHYIEFTKDTNNLTAFGMKNPQI